MPLLYIVGGLVSLGLLIYLVLARPGSLRAPAPSGRATAESGGARRRLAGFLVQYRRELRDEHQLAGLRRRGDHELPHPDARADRAELRFGGDGHGRRR